MGGDRSEGLSAMGDGGQFHSCLTSMKCMFTSLKVHNLKAHM